MLVSPDSGTNVQHLFPFYYTRSVYVLDVLYCVPKWHQFINLLALCLTSVTRECSVTDRHSSSPPPIIRCQPQLCGPGSADCGPSVLRQGAGPRSPSSLLGLSVTQCCPDSRPGHTSATLTLVTIERHETQKAGEAVKKARD